MANTKSSKKKETSIDSSVVEVKVEATDKHTNTEVESNVNVIVKDVPNGKVLVGTFDDAGKDLNQDFYIGKSQFDKFYSNNSKFKIKKKA